MENTEQVEDQPKQTPTEDSTTIPQEQKPKRERRRKNEENDDGDNQDETPGSNSANRQNRGRRQPKGQEDSMKQQKKEYRVKNGDGQAAGDEAETPKRPQTTRNRSSRRGAAAKDGAEAEEYKGGTGGRARSNRRRRNQSQGKGDENDDDADAPNNNRNERNRKPQKKEPTQQEKARAALDKKREKMSHQYQPFEAKKTFNSRFGEYQFAEWRKRRNNLFVTIDTIVPSMPKKVLQEPDDAQYHLEVAAIDEQIEKMQDEFNDRVAEQHEARTSMKEGQQGRNPIRDQLRELFGELNEYNQEKKECFGKIEQVERKIQNLDRELQKQRKNVHPIYNDETKLEKGVKELEKRLATTNWSRIDEGKLIKEIDQVKASKPFFVKIAAIREQINEHRREKDEIRQSMAPTNKIINSLKERIDKVKASDSVFDKDKQLKQYDLTNIRVQIDKIMEKKRELQNKKRECKEAFYGRMCDYEIQQALIKDIEWITQTKQMVSEKADRQSKYDQERKERNEARRKMAEERKKKDDEYKARQEERRKEQEDKRKEWEQEQLEKLNENPYQTHIDLCEELIYFCAKNMKKAVGEDAGPEESKTDPAEETAAAREKRVADAVKTGKIEVAKSKAERSEGNEMNALQQAKGKKQRNRTGPNAFYYEDEDRLNLDYAYVQKFGQLEISPPTEITQLEEVNKRLVELRDALRVKGDLQMIEGKSKLTKDKSVLESEEYTSMTSKWGEVSEAVKDIIKKIQTAMAFKRQQSDDVEDTDRADRNPRRRDNDRYDGGNRGNRGNRGGRGGRRDGDDRQQQRGGRRGDNEQGDGRPRGRRNRDYEDQDDQEETKQPRKGGNNKPREQIQIGGDDFPSM